SNKSFLGRLMGGAAPEERLPASLAAEVVAAANGAAAIRTHNVAQTRAALEALRHA
ncbi:MAG: dihydropteroate synthase, partial [Thaumarchaeota archaeon S15]